MEHVTSKGALLASQWYSFLSFPLIFSLYLYAFFPLNPKATNLAPTDPNGKADPYVVVKVGQQQMDSKERYIPKQLNPVFGE